MLCVEKPPLRLWAYNHPMVGISDQVDFFVEAMRQHGYVVTVSDQPSNTALNVVIENFSVGDRDKLISFCRNTGKKISVIMTEHLDLMEGQLFFHGDPLWHENDYMDPTLQASRLRFLFDCTPWIKCFFVLGDLPELRGFSDLLPRMDVHTIPFPRIAIVRANPEMKCNITDTVFTGVITGYRANLISIIEASESTIFTSENHLSKVKRNSANQSASIVLNLPQRRDWKWLSSMRIMAALRNGRATVSLGTSDDSKIACCTYQLDISHDNWLEKLGECAANWQELYLDAHKNYSIMARSFEKEVDFPHELFEVWAVTERIGE